jgi:septation ring formation regulator EzrA
MSLNFNLDNTHNTTDKFKEQLQDLNKVITDIDAEIERSIEYAKGTGISRNHTQLLYIRNRFRDIRNETAKAYMQLKQIREHDNKLRKTNFRPRSRGFSGVLPSEGGKRKRKTRKHRH